MKRIHAFGVAGIAGWMIVAGGQVAQAQATGSSAEGGVGR